MPNVADVVAHAKVDALQHVTVVVVEAVVMDVKVLALWDAMLRLLMVQIAQVVQINAILIVVEAAEVVVNHAASGVHIRVINPTNYSILEDLV